MSGVILVILGAAVGVMLPVWLLRHGRSEARSPAGTARSGRPPGPAARLSKSLATRFHGVSIRPGPDPCGAARALVGQRYLPAETPPIPLKACDKAQCQCAYAHHSDRRDSEDRRTGWGAAAELTVRAIGGDRRSKKSAQGRRTRG